MASQDASDSVSSLIQLPNELQQHIYNLIAPLTVIKLATTNKLHQKAVFETLTAIEPLELAHESAGARLIAFDGINRCKNLHSLTVHQRFIYRTLAGSRPPFRFDVSNLVGLSKLRSLSFRDVTVISFDGLSALSGLTSLDISINIEKPNPMPCSTLSSILEGIPGLKCLNLARVELLESPECSCDEITQRIFALRHIETVITSCKGFNWTIFSDHPSIRLIAIPPLARVVDLINTASSFKNAVIEVVHDFEITPLLAYVLLKAPDLLPYCLSQQDNCLSVHHSYIGWNKKPILYYAIESQAAQLVEAGAQPNATFYDNGKVWNILSWTLRLSNIHLFRYYLTKVSIIHGSVHPLIPAACFHTTEPLELLLARFPAIIDDLTDQMVLTIVGEVLSSPNCNGEALLALLKRLLPHQLRLLLHISSFSKRQIPWSVHLMAKLGAAAVAPLIFASKLDIGAINDREDSLLYLIAKSGDLAILREAFKRCLLTPSTNASPPGKPSLLALVALADESLFLDCLPRFNSSDLLQGSKPAVAIALTKFSNDGLERCLSHKFNSEDIGLRFDDENYSEQSLGIWNALAHRIPGKQEYVSRLIACGLSPNRFEPGAFPPICQFPSYFITSLILAGADVNVRCAANLQALPHAHRRYLVPEVCQDNLAYVTPLIYACLMEDKLFFEHLIKAKADVDLPNGLGITPLVASIYSFGREKHSTVEFDIVHELLKAGANPNRATEQHCSPLTLALAQSSSGPKTLISNAVSSMLMFGAALNLEEFQNFRPQLNPLACAINIDASLAFCRALVEKHPSFAKDVGAASLSALGSLCCKGMDQEYMIGEKILRNDQEDLEYLRLLFEFGADPRVLEPDGSSPLQLCITNGKDHLILPMCKQDKHLRPQADSLLDLVNQPFLQNRLTPLGHALQLRQTEKVVLALLDAGADPLQETQFETHFDGQTTTPACMAASPLQSSQILKLFVSRGVDINYRFQNKSLLERYLGVCQLSNISRLVGAESIENTINWFIECGAEVPLHLRELVAKHSAAFRAKIADSKVSAPPIDSRFSFSSIASSTSPTVANAMFEVPVNPFAQAPATTPNNPFAAFATKPNSSIGNVSNIPNNPFG